MNYRDLIISKLVYERNGAQYIRLGNSRLDFSKEYLFKGFTASGNIRLVDVWAYGEGNTPLRWHNRLAKVEVRKDEIKIHTEAYTFAERIELKEVLA